MHRRVLVIVFVLAVVFVAGMFLLINERRPAPQLTERAPSASGSAPRVPTPPRRTESPAPAAPRRLPTPRAAEPAPPAVPEKAPETATLHITSDVPGAQVFIDRQFVGATPVTAGNIKPGTHQLNASVEGFTGWPRAST